MSPIRPARSGVRIPTMVAPYVMTRTSTPWALASVKRSIAAPSGVLLNEVCVRNILNLDQVGDADRPFLIDAVAHGDAGEARHRTGARIGQLHIVGHVDLFEDEIAQPIVAAAVALEHPGHRHPRPLAEALGNVDFVAVG